MPSAGPLSRLRGLRLPTLVIHGEAERLPTSVAEETAGTVDGTRLLTVLHAGHMPFWETPERFLAAADAFLSNDDPGTRL